MIEKLAYCIKGSPREVELGQYTLVIGRNGIGKSAVSIAAQLAVADSAELNGKVVKLPSRLIDLGNADGAYAHAVLSNGTESSWGAARQADGSTKHLFEPAACVVPAEVLPLRAVRDVLSGNAETVRTAMLGWMVGGVSAEDVLAAVPAEMHARVKPVLNTKASPAAALLDAVRATEERVKLAKAGADAAEAAAEQLAGSEPVEESAVEEARAAVESWRRVLDQAIAFETASMLTAAPDGSADEERARARVTAAETALAAIPDTGRAEAAVRLLEGHGDACPACSSAVGAGHLDACLTWFRASLQDIPARRRDAEAEVHAARHALALAQAKPTLRVMPENPGVTTAAARESLQAWERVWGARSAKRSAWASVTASKERARALRAEVGEIEALLDALVAARETVLKKGVGAFTAEVQRFMPLKWHITFRPELDFRPAIDTGSGVFTELSATQRDAVEVAIGMAVASRGVAAPKRGRPSKRVAAEDKFYLAIPEDRDRDPKTLAELMRAWSEFRGQVIVEATKRPAGRLPEGWKVIDLDAEEDAEGARGDAEGSSAGPAEQPVPQTPPPPPAGLSLPPPPPEA